MSLLFEWDPRKAGSNFNIMKKMQNDPEMLEEYDSSKGVRGKYAKRFSEGTNVVVIDPDIADYFPDHDAVNQSLRPLVSIIKKREKRGPTALKRLAVHR